MKVNVATDCGNAPKRIFLRDFNIAFAGGDIDAVLAGVADNIVWEIVGERTIEGKAAFEEAIRAMAGMTTAKLTIHSILSHGREGAINGTIVLESGERYGFCDVCTFNSAKGSAIKQLTSYTIPLT